MASHISSIPILLMRDLSRVHAELFPEPHSKLYARKPGIYQSENDQFFKRQARFTSEEPLPPLISTEGIDLEPGAESTHLGSGMELPLRELPIHRVSVDQSTIFDHFTKFAFMRSYLSRSLPLVSEERRFR